MFLNPAMVHQSLLIQLGAMGFEDHREAVRQRSGDGHVKLKKNGKPVPHPKSGIDAVIIHATDTTRTQTRPTKQFETINAHFVVLRRGKVLYLHDIEEYLNASHAFNKRSIAIEHELKPPDEKQSSLDRVGIDRDLPTVEQIRCSRLLLRLLKGVVPNLKYVYGHKQTANKLCPGPHLWYNVVRWAERNLGLTSGGRDYTENTASAKGQPIPKVWDDDKFDLMGEAAAAAQDRAIDLALQQMGQDFPPP